MSYFEEAVDSRREATVNRTIDYLTDKQYLFDAVAFTGISGAVFAPIIAYHFRKAIIPIRKKFRDGANLEPAHSWNPVEAPNHAGGYNILIVDDFVSTGTTVKTMIEALKVWDSASKVVAVYSYKQQYFSEATRLTKQDLIGVPLWCIIG